MYTLFFTVFTIGFFAFIDRFLCTGRNIVTNTIRNVFCGIAQFILRIFGRRDLSIIHKILHLVFGTDQRRLHTLGGNSRFVKDLDVLDVFLGFNLTQSYRPLSERVSYTFFATTTNLPLL